MGTPGRSFQDLNSVKKPAYLRSGQSIAVRGKSTCEDPEVQINVCSRSSAKASMARVW